MSFPLPAKTSAFFCADCGAVSLSSDGICKVQGKGTRSDWCGIKHVFPAHECKKNIHRDRYVCENCGQLAINPELLCKPKKVE